MAVVTTPGFSLLYEWTKSYQFFLYWKTYGSQQENTMGGHHGNELLIVALKEPRNAFI
jgi:hypothetical protein